MIFTPLALLTPVFPASEAHPVFFLDRDDTLIPDRPYRNTPDGMALFPHAGEGLRRLRNAGFRLILLSNQSGIGRGRITLDQLQAIHKRMEELLAAEAVQLDAAFYCPHTPDDHCTCRKPHPGMIQAAQKYMALDLSRAAMIGDKPADIQLARNAGITPIQLFLPGRECLTDAAYTATDLLDAAKWFLAYTSSVRKR